MGCEKILNKNEINEIITIIYDYNKSKGYLY